MSETYTLSRDGLRAVRFQGTLLAESSGKWHQQKDMNRWYDLMIYATDDGRFVVTWSYCSLWQGEQDHRRVEVASTLASVVTELEDFDPTQWVEGYKAKIARHGAHEAPQEYRSRQATLDRQIRERYAAQVRELCATLAETHDLVEEL